MTNLFKPIVNSKLLKTFRVLTLLSLFALSGFAEISVTQSPQGARSEWIISTPGDSKQRALFQKRSVGIDNAFYPTNIQNLSFQPLRFNGRTIYIDPPISDGFVFNVPRGRFLHPKTIPQADTEDPLSRKG